MNMKKKIGIVLLILALLVAGGGIFCWNYYTKYVNIATIYPGVTIQGMDVGGLTKEEAEKKVAAYVNEVLKEKVVLKVGEKKKSFAIARTGLSANLPEVVKQADDLGRKGNLFRRVLQIHALAHGGKDIPLTFVASEKKTEKILEEKGKAFLTEKKNAELTRKDGKFILKKEVNGVSIDFNKNAKELIRRLEDPEWDQKKMVFAMDYETDPAEHTQEELKGIQDRLGSFTTSYAGSSEGRCANVENGARLINGTILYPGESLSVYDKVAPFTAEHGYHLAGSYENGKTVQTYGGGICQVSTTLYNAVLRAELEVLERQPHSMTVHYVDLSKDAAIAGTEKDLRFKNNLDAPVYIEGQAGGNSITFTIYGQEYRDKDRTIEFVSERTSTRPMGEKIIKDKTLEEGKKVVEEPGTTGYTARLWKVIYEKGKETDRVLVNKSAYMAVKKVTRVGTKKKAEKADHKEKKKKDKKKSTGHDDGKKKKSAKKKKS